MIFAKLRYKSENEWRFAKGELLENSEQCIRIRRNHDNIIIEIPKSVDYELQTEGEE